MTYATLKSDVDAYLHRGADLTAKVPTFIQIAEAMLFRELNIKELQTSVTGTTTGGYGALPSDFGTVSRVMVTYGSTTYSLDYAAQPIAFTGTDAAPGYYALENDQLKIYGTGDGQAYELFYVPEVAALSDSNTSNWILENAYDLYLYASCAEGARYVRNQTEIDRLTALTNGLLDGVKRYSERRGQPATGSLQIKPRRAWTN